MIKIFGREPVYWLSGLTALLAVLVAIPGVNAYLTPDAAAWVVTVGTALLGAWEAWSVRPFTVSVMTNAVKTTLAAVVMFGLPIPDGLDAALVALGTFIIGTLMTPDVTPRAFPDLAWLRDRERGGGGSHIKAA